MNFNEFVRICINKLLASNCWAFITNGKYNKSRNTLFFSFFKIHKQKKHIKYGKKWKKFYKQTNLQLRGKW